MTGPCFAVLRSGDVAHVTALHRAGGQWSAGQRHARRHSRRYGMRLDVPGFIYIYTKARHRNKRLAGLCNLGPRDTAAAVISRCTRNTAAWHRHLRSKRASCAACCCLSTASGFSDEKKSLPLPFAGPAGAISVSTHAQHAMTLPIHSTLPTGSPCKTIGSALRPSTAPVPRMTLKA